MSPDISWEVVVILKEAETYEAGPPVLSAEEPEALDARVDEVEIERVSHE